MRPSVRMCALALALAIAVVAAVPPARAEMDKPSWTAGDYWIYSSTDVGFGLSGPGTVRYDVLGPDTVNVGGTDYASYRLRVTPNSNSSTVTFNAGDVWYRTSDLALVKGTWNVTADVPFFGRVVILVTVTFTPPLGLRWPFAFDRTWTATSTIATVTKVGGLPPGTNTLSLTDTFVVLAGGEHGAGAVVRQFREPVEVTRTHAVPLRRFWVPRSPDHRLAVNLPGRVLGGDRFRLPSAPAASWRLCAADGPAANAAVTSVRCQWIKERTAMRRARRNGLSSS